MRALLTTCVLCAIFSAAHKPCAEQNPPVPRNATIKVDVSLVIVPVVVTDKSGKYIPRLKASEFHVFEDNKEQRIDRLIAETEPFYVALMIDSSGSTHFQLEEMQNAAIAFVEALRPQDRVMVVSFDNETHFDSDFTEDRVRLRQSILQPHEEGGRTRLYDALQLVNERLSLVNGRKAAVLFTDGVDNGSIQADSDSNYKTIEKSDVVVYAIQYDTRKDGPVDRIHVPLPPGYASFNELYSRAVNYLLRLTARGGGRVYNADTVMGLKQAFDQIAHELPRQYTLCYYPANVMRDDSYHRIRVTVDRPGARIRTRPGYRATSARRPF